jgi:DNA excision repair protein ERCC-3
VPSEVDIVAVREEFNKALEKLDQIIASLKEQRNLIVKEFEHKLEQYRLGQLDRSLLDQFFEEPYVLIPKRQNEWYVIAPRWLNIQLGYLERSTKGYNIFVVNQYTRWFCDIPPSLQTKLRFKEGFPFKVHDGVLWTGPDYQDVAWQKYRKFFTRREGKDRIRIKKGYEFQIIAQMIEDGTLPFMPTPVSSEDIRPWKIPVDLAGLYSEPYIKQAWKEFKEKGAVGVFWPFGAGKSLFGLYACARIKGKKLVVVPTLTLKEQWLERIRKYIPQYQYEIEVVTYHSYHKVRDKQYTLVIFDECQHLPAPTFIRLSTIRAKYRMGFSGSPYREDGHENYIIALTGFPIGMSWEEMLKRGVIKEPRFKVYILPDRREKLRKLKELLRIPLKTIVFCDWINLGKTISQKFGIPFIYGETEDRLEMIRKSDVCVVSRVGDEGLSVADLERVIEVAFLRGSRMQESQRFGRLLHSSSEETEHIILMTNQEFEKYQKRLYAITERGFKINIIR